MSVDGRWMPFHVAARACGMGRSWVYYHVSRGRLSVERTGRTGYVNVAECRRLLASPLYTDSVGRRVYTKPGPAPLAGVRASSTVALRFTPTERQAIEAAAKAGGQTLSDFCRVAINEAVCELAESRPLRVVNRKRPSLKL